jgi:hypothetical protein
MDLQFILHINMMLKEQVSNFVYLGSVVLEGKRDTGVKLQKCKEINCMIKRHVDTNVN